ncbi:MAG: DUF1428 family protein [Bdellovibrionaceae bacterium]|nr:DUF1428 family protein [Pseudobdellovibrionaceae bacterium]
MFAAIYFYKIPNDRIDQFLSIQKQAADIYRRHGAIDDATFAPSNLAARYGCTSLLSDVTLEPNEELFFSLSLFKSKEDHDLIMLKLDRDPEILSLYDETCKVIDVSRILRGEFNRIV